MQGESTLAGTACVFIRLAGCPLNCNYCDTPQAIPLDSGEAMSIAAIIEKVEAFAPPLVLVTGGEPLAQKSCIPLLAALLDLGLNVQLETAGAHDILHVPDAVSIIMDIKTPGSGESARNRWQNIAHLKTNDEVKIVINSRDDYEWARQVITEKGVIALSVPILFSPAWDRLDPAQLVAWILEDALPVRLQLQQHKYIWGANRRGV
ncbi:MAG TPA: radical SAM protein [Hyphomicrobiales bacterium]|nr:radical SAM protein [Hyphomicrobiales bacterium]